MAGEATYVWEKPVSVTRSCLALIRAPRGLLGSLTLAAWSG
ncbi:hypothetical protein [Aeromicrobium sp. UC242_57]